LPNAAAIFLAASGDESIYLVKFHILSQDNKFHHLFQVANVVRLGIMSKTQLHITDIKNDACEYGSVSYALH
jgi:hypothetical protein